MPFVSLLLFVVFFETFSVAQNSPPSWQDGPSQDVDSKFHRDFDYKHDQGFYFQLGFGPQWNQSLQNPTASGIRFGGNLAIGFIPVENLAIHADVWGNYLDEASVLSIGPGVTYFLGDSNVGIGGSIGIGQVFASGNVNRAAFRETVLSGEFSAGKYWWIGPKSSVGVSVNVGLYGLTLSSGDVSSTGWHSGLKLEYIFN